MSLASVFAEGEAINRTIVLRQTWGHLDAPPGYYPGHILFCLGVHGDITVINWEFNDVAGNPWIYEELHDFVGEHCVKSKRAWGVWRFDGAYRRFKNGKAKFTGNIRPCRVSYRFNGKSAE